MIEQHRVSGLQIEGQIGILRANQSKAAKHNKA